MCLSHQQIRVDIYVQCKRAENFRKHMQLLWQNNIPMCIEVLLCADCQCGQQKAQSPEVANIPSSTDLLLEQWIVTMVTKRLVPLSCNCAASTKPCINIYLH
jgi:hypothetical protein